MEESACVPLEALGPLLELVEPLEKEEAEQLYDYLNCLLDAPGDEHISLGKFYAFASAVDSLAFKKDEQLGEEARKIIYALHRQYAPDSNGTSSRVPVQRPLDSITSHIQDGSVIDLAVDEVRRLHHAHIGSQHLLLCAALQSNIAASLLKERRIAVQDIRKAVEELSGVHESVQELRFTAMSKYVIEVSSSSDLAGFPEADRILIAICRIGDGIGSKILTNFKVDLRIFESEILVGLGVPDTEASVIARQSLIDRLNLSIRSLDRTIQVAHRINDASYLKRQMEKRSAAEAELTAVVSES